MSLQPDYGQTPVPGDELQWLLPQARELLGEPVTKAAVYDLEQEIQSATAEDLMTAVLLGTQTLSPAGAYALSDSYDPPSGQVTVDELITDSFLRALHDRLYGDIWSWAGTFRKTELNVGVAPERIAVDLRISLESVKYRWDHTKDWTPRQLGIAVHAEAVRIHPFTDGNGRSTRLLADLVFAASQQALAERDDEVSGALLAYDWDLDKAPYINLLLAYERHRDPRHLAEFVPVRAFGS